MNTIFTRIDKEGNETQVEIQPCSFDDLHSNTNSPSEIACRNAEVGTRFKLDGVLYGKRRILYMVVERIEES